ncbi:MAG: toprim domain-containing protein, partial [Nocardioidaceae bacterium]
PEPNDDNSTLADLAAERTSLPLLQPIERRWPNHGDETAPDIPATRLYAANAAACEFYESRLEGSWAELHLVERFGTSLASDPRFRPGHAPAGWTRLVDHLRGRGFTDVELVAAGLAKTARTGNLIDRFRDRAVLPVIVDGKVLGFIGRRNPTATDGDKAGPKYLNTPATDIFTKGRQLYGIADDHLADSSIPVLVEGPMDAIAVTLATAGAYVGVAPLGTALTDEQASQLAQFDRDPIVATDGDLAGRMAAERDYWLLTRYGLQPQHIQFADGADPASTYADDGPTPLRAALFNAAPLAQTLIATRIELHDPGTAIIAAARVAAAETPSAWEGHIADLAAQLKLTPAAVERYLGTAVASFNGDRRRYTETELGHISDLRQRIEQQANAAPAERWAALGRRVDARLVDQPDWPATAAMLEEIAATGVDVEQLVAAEVAKERLRNRPATDLRYRLVGHLPTHDGASGPDLQRTRPTQPAEQQPRFTPERPDHAPGR